MEIIDKLLVSNVVIGSAGLIDYVQKKTCPFTNILFSKGAFIISVDTSETHHVKCKLWFLTQATVKTKPLTHYILDFLYFLKPFLTQYFESPYN